MDARVTMKDRLSEKPAGALALLTPEQTRAADAAAMAGGVPGHVLMENAGWSIARACMRRLAPCRVFVACGPGNNGGDGFVAARWLRKAGWPVQVALLGDVSRLKGDAARAAALWGGPIGSVADGVPERTGLIIDALFGAGLSRPVRGAAGEMIRRINAMGEAGRAHVLAVDVPSGLDGAAGRPLGETVVRADTTVTFFRKKPGHVLMPGRALCGDVIVTDIGIPERVLDDLDVRAFENAPPLWREELPRLHVMAHKYQRGHLMALSGPASRTGAARLAAAAGLRIGAGLVTLASPGSAILVNAAHLSAVMLARVDKPHELLEEIRARRIRALVMGPAAGVGGHTREMALAALKETDIPVVLDADALTSFAGDPDRLFSAIKGRAAPVMLTPHEGEFARLFPELSAGDGEGAEQGGKLWRARRAAGASGAVIVLKGPDTVIAAPSGLAAINTNAPPWLATAGSGDVLCGIIGGLLAQGMEAWPAACAAVWLHGRAAGDLGRAMTVRELPRAAARALARLAGNAPEER